MKRILSAIPANIILITGIFLITMFLFSCERVLLFIIYQDELKKIPFQFIVSAIRLGLGFDAVISCYILSLPLLVFFIFQLLKKNFTSLQKGILIYIFILTDISLFILWADVPWFEHSQNRITTVAIQWSNTPGMMLKFIFEDVHNYPYLLLFILSAIGFHLSVYRLRKKIFLPHENYSLKKIPAYLLFFLLLITGMRGRLALKSPIRWGSAFVSSYNLTNQLGLNPVYTFMQSWIDEHNSRNKEVHYMDDSAAVERVQRFYNITKESTLYSPVARKIVAKGNPSRFNVVFVIMESMATNKIGEFGNKDQLTPTMNRLAEQSILFDHFYSDGIHTFNGVYSSLFGLPSLPLKHHMKDLKSAQPHNGFATVLQNENYRTIFFTTHDDQFDNLGGFLSPNGFQQVICQQQYPQEKILSTLGVPDHVMFDDAVQRLNEFHRQGKLFFAALLTGSDHGPYHIPNDIPFHPHSTEIKKQATEYADWAIGHFLDACSKQPWFDSTIFIFTGDHGALAEGKDMYLSFHHIPLIFYAPHLLKPKRIEKLGGQIDIFPTLLGLLHCSYINNSFGINLFEEERSMLPFTYDDELGCISANCFYILRKENSTLFRIHDDERCCDIVNDSLRSDSLVIYAKSVMQTMQSMIRSRQLY
jgi:phosphoglycerol transferase MdoB-like AlkP superfamily enzyme